MNEDITKVIEESKEWKTENIDWTLVLLILIFGFGGWGSNENSKINELEKKAARLEGQMSMIGGKKYE